MKYIIDFFKKEKKFFKGSFLLLLSSFFSLFVLSYFYKYNIIGKDRFLLFISFCISYELYRNGLDILFADNKK